MWRSACPFGFESPAELAKLDDIASSSALSQRSFYDIYRNASLESDSLSLRRSLQIGMGLEFAASQSANLLFHDGMTEVISTVSDANNFMVGLHIAIMWRYHIFIRNAVMVRHITRIAVAYSSHSDEQQHESSEPAEIIIESGPWRRHLRLITEKDALALQGSGSVSLKRLCGVGAFHMDVARGEVLDSVGLDKVLSMPLDAASEELMIDDLALERSFIKAGTSVPVLGEFTEESLQHYEGQLKSWPQLSWLLQFSGARALNFFGKLALAMGISAAVMWFPVPLRP